MTTAQPKFIGVIFAGGEAKRFGDIKALSIIAGKKPVLHCLYDILRSAGAHVAVSVGPLKYKVESRALPSTKDDLLYDYLAATVEDESDSRYAELVHLSKVNEVRDYVYANLPASVTFDSSKGACIKNIATTLNGKFTILPPNLHVDRYGLEMLASDHTKAAIDLNPPSKHFFPDHQIIEISYSMPPLVNIATADPAFLWQANIADMGQCVDALYEVCGDKGLIDFGTFAHLPVDLGDDPNRKLRFNADSLREFVAGFNNGPVVAINADTITVPDLQIPSGNPNHLATPLEYMIKRARAAVDASYKENLEETDLGIRLLLESKLLEPVIVDKLRNGAYSAYIGISKLVRPKKSGRVYEISEDGLVTRISDKTKDAIVDEEAIVFAFKPASLLDLQVPKDASTSDLCQILIERGHKVFGERFPNIPYYDLNSPFDCFMLRRDCKRVDFALNKPLEDLRRMPSKD